LDLKKHPKERILFSKSSYISRAKTILYYKFQFCDCCFQATIASRLESKRK
jgi:hypothetical protein